MVMLRLGLWRKFGLCMFFKANKFVLIYGHVIKRALCKN